jgi:putative mRNA 3-end processing factor
MAVDLQDLIVLRREGMYCPAGDFYIDPWRPVPTAVITHGHGDHARVGMGVYHATAASIPILQWRLGEQVLHAHDYGEAFQLGDYKRQYDPTCAPFEVVPCDVFITEATFGLPVYQWPDTPRVIGQIADWRRACAERGRAAILYCYALGKAQRILAELARQGEPAVALHGAIQAGVEVYRQAGIDMVETTPVSEQPKGTDYAGRLVMAPPSAAGSPWIRRFRDAEHGFASGWMRLRGNRRRRNYDRGFVISDHADWPALLATVAQTGARRIIATHGNTDALIRVLQEQGYEAQAFATDFGAEE